MDVCMQSVMTGHETAPSTSTAFHLVSAWMPSTDWPVSHVAFNKKFLSKIGTCITLTLCLKGGWAERNMTGKISNRTDEPSAIENKTMSWEKKKDKVADNEIGPPKPFDVAKSQSAIIWEDWIQGFEWHAHAIQLQKKAAEVLVANVMTMIRPEAQNIYKAFTLAEKKSKNVEGVQLKFREYFIPRTNHAYERCNFNQMKQR